MSGQLLMIPGPVEISAAVAEAAGGQPPGHLSPGFVEAFGAALRGLRRVWGADDDHQPFVLSGSGTLAMEAAVANLVGPGHRVVVLSTGVFGERCAEMARRRGARVDLVRAAPGEVPEFDEVDAALRAAPARALFATHVDTSTGVRIDPEPLCALARTHGALSVLDGVCAVGGERLEQAAWGVDCCFTASQKAIGLPPGLALLVASPAALAARADNPAPPPLSLDWVEWLPVHRAYERGERAYLSTPATGLVRALVVGLAEILERPGGVHARVARHRERADQLRAAWAALGLDLVPVRPGLAANTLSALRFPAGIGAELVAEVGARGVVVAGALHPALQGATFRVGHLGHVVDRPADLRRTVRAIGEALAALGHARDVEAAVACVEAAS